MHKFYIFLLFIIIMASCKPAPDFSKTGNIEFSTDTVSFDTVFQGIGSATKILKIYNNNNYFIRLDRVFLNRNNSPYKLNINGISANKANNLLIAPKDSMYIFIEVKINPDENDLIESDSITIISGDIRKSVILWALGRDVHFYKDSIIQSEKWSNDKPYLIYNYLIVDSAKTLEINEGCEIYFHRKAKFAVRGELKVLGTKDAPVYFLSDRLEDDYVDVPGQWGGIWITMDSRNNIINYAVIRNATIGIQVDTTQSWDTPALKVSNTRIENCSFAGLYAQASFVVALNCIIDNCGYYATALVLGGKYEFHNCTLANYWDWTIRNYPALAFNNYLTYNQQNYYWGAFSAVFSNCVITGNLKNEFVADSIKGGQMSFVFQNCLMKLDPEYNNFQAQYYKNCIFNKEPLFTDADSYDFSPTENSPLINNGTDYYLGTYPALMFDINGTQRTDGPDIGAIEYRADEENN